jgi:hypothetical protein
MAKDEIRGLITDALMSQVPLANQPDLLSGGAMTNVDSYFTSPNTMGGPRQTLGIGVDPSLLDPTPMGPTQMFIPEKYGNEPSPLDPPYTPPGPGPGSVPTQTPTQTPVQQTQLPLYETPPVFPPEIKQLQFPINTEPGGLQLPYSQFRPDYTNRPRSLAQAHFDPNSATPEQLRLAGLIP